MGRDITETLESAIEKEPAIKSVSDGVRNWNTRTFDETSLRSLKNFLNGTWLEHPLHPLLTDVPIGAWTISMALDLLSMFGVEGLGEASAISTGLGTAAATGAAVTGLMDFTDVDPPEGAVGATHGIINILATLFFGLSFFLRWRDRWRTSGLHVLLSTIGYLLVSVGAYLGGSLVFRQGVMVNRNAYRKGPKEFTPVLRAEELASGVMKRVEVKGQPILLVKQGDSIYAIGAVCSHYGAPLEKGKLVDGCIECPWHYSLYSLQDGSYKRGPTTSPVPAYDTRINNGQIEVRMRAE